MSNSDAQRVIIAEVTRARGNVGEVVVISQTDVPGRLEQLRRIRVRLANGSDKLVDIESSWQHKGDWIFKFAGVDTISAAELFRGAELWIEAAERGELPKGQYFQSDLIGCVLVDRAAGQVIGEVIGYQDFGASSLLDVDHDGRSVLIPLVPDICQVIDIDAKQILVELPEGLLDL